MIELGQLYSLTSDMAKTLYIKDYNENIGAIREEQVTTFLINYSSDCRNLERYIRADRPYNAYIEDFYIDSTGIQMLIKLRDGHCYMYTNILYKITQSEYDSLLQEWV